VFEVFKVFNFPFSVIDTRSPCVQDLFEGWLEAYSNMTAALELGAKHGFTQHEQRSSY
jgi:hypothetical protein